MARKSKKNSKKIATNDKAEFTKILEERKKSQQRASKNKQKTDSNNNSQLYDKFKDLFQKFEQPKNISENTTTISQDAPTFESNKKRKIIEDSNAITEPTQDLKIVSVEEEDNNSRPSKRKLRKLTKPTLAELKGISNYPENIEWFDCDAPYPYLLAGIKTSKNIIPIPPSWQQKRGYLSGRSLLNKRPFQLPSIIRETGIEEMRKISLGEDISNEKSLKEITRSRVQPKTDTFDLDYKKLYDVFFKIGKNWKPSTLLPFGDLYFENRNLVEDAEWKSKTKDLGPGKLSSRMRNIIGLKAGQLPPWIHKMKELGLPPSYPSLKIVGLNWDISDLVDGIYGTLEDTSSGNSIESGYFGEMINFEHDSEPKKEYNFNSQNNTTNGKKETDISLTEVDMQDSSDTGIIKSQNINDDGKDKQLYRILKENTESSDSIDRISTSKIYNLISDSNKSSSSSFPSGNPKTNSESEKEEDSKYRQNFKF
ncbi:hypothetical protein TBLA_0D00790 [Henningerozyma blattae CBS 6284]|uniref:PSP proline-rich domain-containing protein n=1 Tax=Henningerozyma blattae (strain ATCC 34711 / CBS 6284 / DSM 70876 / NBRC 10599 / NRRL Y-10934 / UCD 77-7) TaxID=1071380 RepID=I2H2I5_HENB6|nr:hypothetical protein TBLA_0D00790 [Tetrapisispora blattae CBS 6284]CCH60587.1 hypothetical protein TBLA_0D00790 [Tetrapisispora blattae CBS 6284]